MLTPPREVSEFVMPKSITYQLQNGTLPEQQLGTGLAVRTSSAEFRSQVDVIQKESISRLNLPRPSRRPMHRLLFQLRHFVQDTGLQLQRGQSLAHGEVVDGGETVLQEVIDEGSSSSSPLSSEDHV